MTANEELVFSTGAGSGSRMDDSSAAGSTSGSWRVDIDSVKSTGVLSAGSSSGSWKMDIDSVKSTGVLSATGVLSDSDMDRQVTQRQSMKAPV